MAGKNEEQGTSIRTYARFEHHPAQNESQWVSSPKESVVVEDSVCSRPCPFLRRPGDPARPGGEGEVKEKVTRDERNMETDSGCTNP